jgi:uncharacterized protein YcbX
MLSNYVISSQSLQGMCLLLQESLLERFRSNLVIQGLKPFEENEWTQLQIGKAKFQVSWTCFLHTQRILVESEVLLMH